jgi:hypothetical protein
VRRRGFLLLAGATVIAWHPAAAEVKVPRIGFIQAGSRQENQSLLDAFREKLAAVGWTDGAISLYSTAGPRSAPNNCRPSSRN